MQLLEASLWVAILSAAVLASHWLWRTLGVAVASQGLIANTSALAFVLAQQHGLGPVSSTMAAGATGLALGMAHLALLNATNKEVLLVASVLLTFLWNDLWLSLPSITGGSGGLLLASSPTSAALSLLAAAVAWVLLDRYLVPQAHAVFIRQSCRELGLRAGVLGVPVARVFGGGFALAGAAFGLLGAAGAQAAGVVTPSLFATSWSLSVLAVVIAPGIALVHRALSLPVLFVALRWLLRDQLPPSIGASQLVEFAFPASVLLWSRARNANTPKSE